MRNQTAGHLAVLSNQFAEIGDLKHARTLQNVEELADVARIIVQLQGFNLFRGKVTPMLLDPVAVRNLRNIFLVLAERRQGRGWSP